MSRTILLTSTRGFSRSSGNSGTKSHFHAVDSCQICHLSNYTINQSPGCYHDSSPIRNEGQTLTLLRSYWCGTISQLITVSLPGYFGKMQNKQKGTKKDRIHGDLLQCNALDPICILLGRTNKLYLHFLPFIPPVFQCCDLKTAGSKKHVTATFVRQFELHAQEICQRTKIVTRVSPLCKKFSATKDRQRQTDRQTDRDKQTDKGTERVSPADTRNIS